VYQEFDCKAKANYAVCMYARLLGFHLLHSPEDGDCMYDSMLNLLHFHDIEGPDTICEMRKVVFDMLDPKGDFVRSFEQRTLRFATKHMDQDWKVTYIRISKLTTTHPFVM